MVFPILTFNVTFYLRYLEMDPKTMGVDYYLFILLGFGANLAMYIFLTDIVNHIWKL